MSTHPPIEARVSALERRQTNLETHVEELSEDIMTSLKHLSAEGNNKKSDCLHIAETMETTTF